MVPAGLAGVLLLVDGREGVVRTLELGAPDPLGSVFNSCILCRIGAESDFGGLATGLKPFVAKPGTIDRLYIGKPGAKGPVGSMIAGFCPGDATKPGKMPAAIRLAGNCC